MKYADNSRVKYAIIIGEDEIKNNCVSVKDMASGEQCEVSIKELEKFFK
jgi:histidyl-tRNA synthetase